MNMGSTIMKIMSTSPGRKPLMKELTKGLRRGTPGAKRGERNKLAWSEQCLEG
jgi:hypothetical protein